ncbi:hypothetical protein KI387_032627, partial [Taxus chinensis]
LMSMFADVEPFNKSQSNQSSNPPTHQTFALDNKCSDRQATSENPSTPSDHNSINEPSMEEKVMTVSGQFKSETEVSTLSPQLDEEIETITLNKVSMEVRQTIQKARLEQKLTQSNLVNRINEKPQVVHEYERGKVVPNQAILTKMERALGVKLRRK